jgi:AcrR family transcriptional regulator
MSEAIRPLRADAQRNRERILQVAFEAFASEGLSVPVREITRRAGVSTGTFSRHFPTKEALFEAIVLSRASWLAEQAARLSRSPDPGAAFFEFFDLVIEEGAANRGMAEALAGAGYDLDSSTAQEGLDLTSATSELLARAQHAGAVRGDADAADVKALIMGCLARTPTAADPAARVRMAKIAAQGLRNLLLTAARSGPSAPSDNGQMPGVVRLGLGGDAAAVVSPAVPERREHAGTGCSRARRRRRGCIRRWARWHRARYRTHPARTC